MCSLTQMKSLLHHPQVCLSCPTVSLMTHAHVAYCLRLGSLRGWFSRHCFFILGRLLHCNRNFFYFFIFFCYFVGDIGVDTALCFFACCNGLAQIDLQTAANTVFFLFPVWSLTNAVSSIWPLKAKEPKTVYTSQHDLFWSLENHFHPHQSRNDNRDVIVIRIIIRQTTTKHLFLFVSWFYD